MVKSSSSNVVLQQERQPVSKLFSLFTGSSSISSSSSSSASCVNTSAESKTTADHSKPSVCSRSDDSEESTRNSSGSGSVEALEDHTPNTPPQPLYFSDSSSSSNYKSNNQQNINSAVKTNNQFFTDATTPSHHQSPRHGRDGSDDSAAAIVELLNVSEIIIEGGDSDGGAGGARNNAHDLSTNSGHVADAVATAAAALYTTGDTSSSICHQQEEEMMGNQMNSGTTHNPRAAHPTEETQQKQQLQQQKCSNDDIPDPLDLHQLAASLAASTSHSTQILLNNRLSNGGGGGGGILPQHQHQHQPQSSFTPSLAAHGSYQCSVPSTPMQHVHNINNGSFSNSNSFSYKMGNNNTTMNQQQQQHQQVLQQSNNNSTYHQDCSLPMAPFTPLSTSQLNASFSASSAYPVGMDMGRNSSSVSHLTLQHSSHTPNNNTTQHRAGLACSSSNNSSLSMSSFLHHAHHPHHRQQQQHHQQQQQHPHPLQQSPTPLGTNVAVPTSLCPPPALLGGSFLSQSQSHPYPLTPAATAGDAAKVSAAPAPKTAPKAVGGPSPSTPLSTSAFVTSRLGTRTAAYEGIEALVRKESKRQMTIQKTEAAMMKMENEDSVNREKSAKAKELTSTTSTAADEAMPAEPLNQIMLSIASSSSSSDQDGNGSDGEEEEEKVKTGDQVTSSSGDGHTKEGHHGHAAPTYSTKCMSMIENLYKVKEPTPTPSTRSPPKPGSSFLDGSKQRRFLSSTSLLSSSFSSRVGAPSCLTGGQPSSLLSPMISPLAAAISSPNIDGSSDADGQTKKSTAMVYETRADEQMPTRFRWNPYQS